MDESRIYTRAYLGSSPRQLISGNGPQKVALSFKELEYELQIHTDKDQTIPTSLVSVSDRIIDTVKRAYDFYRDGASPDDIWIVFVKVPSTTQKPPHSAKSLAERCNHPERQRFRHEYLFEGEIPEKYVSHKVSLQTLMDRGLDWETYYPVDIRKRMTTQDLRGFIATTLQHSDDWEAGIQLGSFARLFGARAPLTWIACQLFQDCLGPKMFGEVERGIDTALIDWWLTDDQFVSDWEDFKEWSMDEEAGILEEWDDFEEVWLEGDHFAKAFDQAYKKLYEKHARCERKIEAEAVRIGL